MPLFEHTDYLPIRKPSTTHTPMGWHAQAHTLEHTFRFSNKTVIPNCADSWLRDRTRNGRQSKLDLPLKRHHGPAQQTVLDNELHLLVGP